MLLQVIWQTGIETTSLVTSALKSYNFNIFSAHVGAFLPSSLFLSSLGFKNDEFYCFCLFACDYFNCQIKSLQGFYLFIYFIFNLVSHGSCVQKFSCCQKLACTAPFTYLTSDFSVVLFVWIYIPKRHTHTHIAACTTPSSTALFKCFSPPCEWDQSTVRNPWRKSSDVHVQIPVIKADVEHASEQIKISLFGLLHIDFRGYFRASINHHQFCFILAVCAIVHTCAVGDASFCTFGEAFLVRFYKWLFLQSNFPAERVTYCSFHIGVDYVLTRQV